MQKDDMRGAKNNKAIKRHKGRYSKYKMKTNKKYEK